MIVEETKKLPREWCRENNIYMMDPDGWNQAGKTWFEPVTEAEFKEMLMTSTYSQGSQR